MLFLTCSSSFAQKTELKEIERLIRRSNISEAKALLETVEKTLPSATEDQKAAYHFFKAKIEIALLNSGTNVIENRANAINSINSLLKIENDAKSKKYTTEIANEKNNLLASIVNEAIDNNRSKNYKNSSKLFEQAYTLNAKDTVYLYNAANDAINAKDFDFAESKLKQLIELKYDGKSENFVATNALNNKVESFGNDKKARDLALKKGTHYKPETLTTSSAKPSIYNSLTQILLNKENYSEAEYFALQAYNLDKSNINNLLNILLLYYNTNRLDQFEKYAKQGLELFPKNEQLLYNLALINLKNGENEQALNYLNTIISLNENNFDALKTLGNIELQKDAEVTSKINTLPNTTSANKRRSELMNEKKDVYKKALTYFIKAQNINKKDEGLNELISQIEDFLQRY